MTPSIVFNCHVDGTITDLNAPGTILKAIAKFWLITASSNGFVFFLTFARKVVFFLIFLFVLCGLVTEKLKKKFLNLDFCLSHTEKKNLKQRNSFEWTIFCLNILLTLRKQIMVVAIKIKWQFWRRKPNVFSKR